MFKYIIFLIVCLFLGITCNQNKADDPTKVPEINIPDSLSQQIFLMSYAHFGSSVLVDELLGNPCYQWQNCTSINSGNKHDIKVLLYDNISLSKIKEFYPINPQKKQDFRYIEGLEAVNFLNSLTHVLDVIVFNNNNFQEFDKIKPLSDATGHLKNIRQKIVKHFQFEDAY